MTILRKLAETLRFLRYGPTQLNAAAARADELARALEAAQQHSRELHEYLRGVHAELQRYQAAASAQVAELGDQAAGAPKMEIRVDGVVVARVDVSATSWQTYRTTTTMTPGAHTLSVAFTNDHRNGSIDRNLRVDVVRLVPT